MKLLLANSLNFKKIQIDDCKVLNHVIHMENKFAKLLKKLKEKQDIFDKVYIECILFWIVFIFSLKAFPKGEKVNLSCCIILLF